MIRTWSTADVAPDRQLEHWREAICEAFLDLRPESAVRGPFRGAVTQRRFGALELGSVRSQAQRVYRTARAVDSSPRDSYYANLHVRGRGMVLQDHRTAVLAPGDLALVDTTRPFTMAFDTDFAQLSFHVPRAALEREVGGVPLTARTVSTDRGAGPAVRAALVALQRGDLGEASARRLAAATVELLALLLEEQAAPAASAAPARPPRGLLEAALADVATHLGGPGLTPAATAARLGVSVRLLHRAFERHDRTFAREVRWRRLARAHEQLQDPRRDPLRVIDVAVEAGFVDVTHFHRAFRQRYGRTPAEVRATRGSSGASPAG